MKLRHRIVGAVLGRIIRTAGRTGLYLVLALLVILSQQSSEDS